MQNLTTYFQELTQNPAKIHACYKYFKKYSTRNQFIASSQLETLEPINTYKGWQELNRQVKKGAKAISLIMPVNIKNKDESDEEKEKIIFIPKKNWFKLSDTEGAEFKEIDLTTPTFDCLLALKNLNIQKVAFEDLNGNCQGYAIPDKKVIAINPLAVDPFKTTIHEIAHCLMHGGNDTLNHGIELPVSLEEFEAESVAYILSSKLGIFEGLEYSRGYILSWLRRSSTKPCEKSFLRVLSTVDKILKAGEIK